jgi:hypothetical protein
MSAKRIHQYHIVAKIMMASGIGFVEKLMRASCRENAILRARRDLVRDGYHLFSVDAYLVRPKKAKKS